MTILIKNGEVVDGLGKKPYIADVFLDNGIIKNVGQSPDVIADEIIDAKGLIVAPGFIDTHTHTDNVLSYDRQHINGLLQGITTEIAGQCGLGLVPLEKEMVHNYGKLYTGIFGDLSLPSKAYKNVDGFLNSFDGCTAVNIAVNATHGPIRLAGAGFTDIPLEGDALECSKRALESSLIEGAVGFSSGLVNYPDGYSDTKELIELCKVAYKYDVPFVMHMRTFKDNFNPVEEIIEVGRRTGVKLHFSHYKTQHPQTVGKPEERIKLFKIAMEEGIDISFDLYPYHAGSGSVVVFLPSWAVEGGYDKVMERLSDKILRQKLEYSIENIYAMRTKWTGSIFTYLKNQKEYTGKSFDAVAKEKGMTIHSMIIDVLLENELEVGYRHTEPDDEISSIMDDDVMELLDLPNCMVGTDMIPIGGKPHPRAFGCFPKILRLSREKKQPLEKIINRMTLVPAKRFKLLDRGCILPGKAADLVIFDYSTVTDTATYECPRNAPKGIKYVIVNGEVAVRDEKPTGIFAGKGLRRMI